MIYLPKEVYKRITLTKNQKIKKKFTNYKLIVLHDIYLKKLQYKVRKKEMKLDEYEKLEYRHLKDYYGLDFTEKIYLRFLIATRRRKF